MFKEIELPTMNNIQHMITNKYSEYPLDGYTIQKSESFEINVKILND